jgi:hypothetical protein
MIFSGKPVPIFPDHALAARWRFRYPDWVALLGGGFAKPTHQRANKPGGTMRKYFLPLLAASAMSVVAVAGALAAAVSAKDLSGKKICWSNGSTSSYGAGGKYSNTMSGDGTWAVGGGGLHVHTDRYDYVAKIQKLPDGSFAAVIVGTDMKTTGTYCQ